MLAKYFYMLFFIFLSSAFYSLIHCTHTRTYIRVMIKTYVFDVCICGARNEEDQFLLHVPTFIFRGVMRFENPARAHHI